MEQRDIRDVALYLRKSRGDEETALDKHRAQLIELVKRGGWKHREYVEIGSSDSIEFRPKFKELLAHVREGLYDAVLVVDLDRLSRGDTRDQAEWQHALKTSKTMVITPGKAMDLNDDDTEFWVGIESVFARREYKVITKRLRRGKFWGAKEGRWTNGPPPYPYRYNKATRELDIVPEWRPGYDLAMELLLKGMPLYAICWELNRLGFRTSRGNTWSEHTMQRVLTSEVHLGKIVTGKTSGSGHKNKPAKDFVKHAKDQWGYVPGRHTPVKTPQEHAQIMAILAAHQDVPPRAKNGSHALSGLVKCGRCGYSMQFMYRKVRGGRYDLKTCQHADPFGHRCKMSGCKASVLEQSVEDWLRDERARLIKAIQESGDEVQERDMSPVLGARLAELDELKKSRQKTDWMFAKGKISEERYDEMITQLDEEIRAKNSEITEIREILANAGRTDRDRVHGIDACLAALDRGASQEELNRRYKLVIQRAEYTREGKDISLTVVPL